MGPDPFHCIRRFQNSALSGLTQVERERWKSNDQGHSWTVGAVDRRTLFALRPAQGHRQVEIRNEVGLQAELILYRPDKIADSRIAFRVQAQDPCRFRT